MSVRVELRVSAKDIRRWRFAAALDGRTLSAWIRHQCDGAAFDVESWRAMVAAVKKRNRRTV